LAPLAATASNFKNLTRRRTPEEGVDERLSEKYVLYLWDAHVNAVANYKARGLGLQKFRRLPLQGSVDGVGDVGGRPTNLDRMDSRPEKK